MKLKRNLLHTVLFVLTLAVSAQELPPIENFSTEDYGAENQNWSISQGSNKYIYFANNSGLLEYNGAKWQLYSSPNQTVFRSVKVVDDRVYTGCYMEFGYWERDAIGILEYTSLSKQLDILLIEDEQFWNIIALDDYILFQTLKRIYILNTLDSSVNIIESETELSKMTIEDGTIYFQKKGMGLFKIVNGDAVMVSEDAILKSNTIVNVFKHQEKFLVETQEQGFYILESDILKQWNIPANDILLKTSVYNSIKLDDETFAIGTISNGIIFMTSEGKIDKVINQGNGLINNTVLSVFQDMDHNIWLGLDNGINFINTTSPYYIYKDDNGKLGTVYTSVVHNDMLYLGTNQGLFYKERTSLEKFKFVENTNGQVWKLKVIDGKLFCGHNKGTLIIEDFKIVNTMDQAIGTWDFKRIPNTPNLILEGNFNGLSILEKTDGVWSYRNKIEGIDISSRFFEFANDNLYVNHELKGLYELKVDSEFKKIESTKRLDYLEYGIGSNIFNFNGDLIYTSSAGVFKLNSSEKFVRDTTFSDLFSPFKRQTTMMQINGEDNNLWRFADDNLVFVSSGTMSKIPSLRFFPVSSAIKNVVAGFENVSKISNHEYLVGRYNGYLIINEEVEIAQTDFEIAINSIEVNKIDHPKQRIDPTKELTFQNKENNISFEYSFANYGKIIENKYQYQLLGLSDNWSDWSESSTQVFENLPFGTYTFNVKGRAGNISTNTASFSFTIKRPWLLSNTAIALYALSTILLLFIVHYYYRRYYRNQQQKVVDKTNRELELKELENKQQLMQLNNERLKQDIENKNRELAISTMSLIKKNEFLNNIKEELKNKAENKSLNSVIKIIDKNLNNEDDWAFFEEAFNNADKDFLKKVKAKHASLTPNDLKLCAYLRLNLSSKEIAPLLNISYKSVEVKRYRLRKKMDLPHEASLTNYILEI